MKYLRTIPIVVLTSVFGISLVPYSAEAFSYNPYFGVYFYQTPAATINDGSSFRVNLNITGALIKGGGSFVIDHPLDPDNKLLYHSFVESPDVKNLYDGIATLDANGEVIIALPEYFEALNTDFRYQVKPISTAMPNLYIKKEVFHNAFTIAGGVPGERISWQVTGIRHDPYIFANPLVPEVTKSELTPVKPGEYVWEGYSKSGLIAPFMRFFERLWVSW